MRVEKLGRSSSFLEECKELTHKFSSSPGCAFIFSPCPDPGRRKFKIYSGVKDWVKGGIEAFDWIEHQRQRTETVVAVGYEALHLFEDVPQPKTDNYGTPLVTAVTYESLIELEEELNSSSFLKRSNLSHLSPEELEKIVSGHSNFTKENYKAAVNEIKELILDGEVYQVNLSQQIALPFKRQGEEFFSRILDDSIPLHGGLINDPEGKWCLVSASPERFISREHNGPITASPIKGTRRSGDSELERAKLSEELLSSAKDHAELSMIVDLIRNDLSRICVPGSVRVLAHARLEEHGTVMHLVSDVEGEPHLNIGTKEIFRALFPSGSVTGAPKIAAMREISRLEGTARGPYTGAFGTIGVGDSLSLSVGIRTCLIRDGELRFQVGGGVVIDSSPEEEYIETLHKARVMVEAWRRN